MDQLTHGADSDRLRAIGDALVTLAGRTRTVEGDGTAQAMLLAMHWTGDDADRFGQSWATARTRLAEAAELLDTYGGRARTQAAEQEAGSAGATGGGPPSSAGPRLPMTPPLAAADLYDELEDMTPQERADYLESDEFRDLAVADPEGTKEALDRAFDDGLFADDPVAYADYLEQYWIDQALQQAGIDPAEWDPSQGFDGNRDIVSAVYEYYGELYLANPDLEWAAMANMIGPSFAGGFADLDLARDVAQGVLAGSPLLPPPHAGNLAVLASLSDADLAFYESTLLSMQQEIFFDQGSMHQAYVDGGIAEIERMHAAGVIDDNAMQAWYGIDSGDPSRVDDGNHRLLWREQNQIIVDDYQTMIRIIRNLLRQLGFENVDDASDGSAAIEKMRDKRYGLVISDWNMEPMTGYELLRHVRADEALRTTPFIMVTAESKTENVVAAKKAGVNNYIVKPFTPQLLKEKLDALIAVAATTSR